MKLLQIPVVFCLLFAIYGCAHTSAVMVEGGTTYDAVSHTEILSDYPDRSYKEIAILESRGPVGTPLPDLIENMRQKGMTIGADAVIPIQDASEHAPGGLMYNPWLGGYQTLPGGKVPVLRGVAIKYQ